MAKRGKLTFAEALYGDSPPEHPHLFPFNAGAFERAKEDAFAQVRVLTGYQNFLADARAAKASRKRVSRDFERNVQAQSRQALSAFDALVGRTHGIMQQVNETGMWDELFQRSEAALKAQGPRTAKQMWSEIRAHPDADQALSDLGLTADLLAAADKAIAQTDIVVASRSGAIEVRTRTTPAEDYRAATLVARRGRPGNIVELLAQAGFQKMSRTMGQDVPAAVGTLPPLQNPASSTPGEIVLTALAAGRQRLVEHVRKLEDTGLATYAGEDPGTITVLLVVGIAMAVIGIAISTGCDSDVAPFPVWFCAFGFLLLFLSMLLLFAAVLAAVFVSGGTAILAGIAIGALIVPWIDALNRYESFSVPQTPSQ